MAGPFITWRVRQPVTSVRRNAITANRCVASAAAKNLGSRVGGKQWKATAFHRFSIKIDRKFLPMKNDHGFSSFSSRFWGKSGKLSEHPQSHVQVYRKRLRLASNATLRVIRGDKPKVMHCSGTQGSDKISGSLFYPCFELHQLVVHGPTKMCRLSVCSLSE